MVRQITRCHRAAHGVLGPRWAFPGPVRAGKTLTGWAASPLTRCPSDRAVHEGTADQGRERRIRSFDAPPQDLVELRVIDLVVIAEIHLAGALGAVSGLGIDGVDVDAGRFVLVRSQIGLSGEA